MLDPEGAVVQSTGIPVARTPFMHDFALTAKNVVIWDTPLGFDGFECGHRPWIILRSHRETS